MASEAIAGAAPAQLAFWVKWVASVIQILGYAATGFGWESKAKPPPPASPTPSRAGVRSYVQRVCPLLEVAVTGVSVAEVEAHLDRL